MIRCIDNALTELAAEDSLQPISSFAIHGACAGDRRPALRPDWWSWRPALAAITMSPASMSIRCRSHLREPAPRCGRSVRRGGRNAPRLVPPIGCSPRLSNAPVGQDLRSEQRPTTARSGTRMVIGYSRRGGRRCYFAHLLYRQATSGSQSHVGLSMSPTLLA
jgi:hypothetical protein